MTKVKKMKNYHIRSSVSNDISFRVRLTRQAWYVNQNDVDIGYLYLPKNSVLWGWRSFMHVNDDADGNALGDIFGQFGYDTKEDAADALIRYVASHRG